MAAQVSSTLEEMKKKEIKKIPFEIEAMRTIIKRKYDPPVPDDEGHVRRPFFKVQKLLWREEKTEEHYVELLDLAENHLEDFDCNSREDAKTLGARGYCRRWTAKHASYCCGSLYIAEYVCKFVMDSLETETVNFVRAKTLLTRFTQLHEDFMKWYETEILRH